MTQPIKDFPVAIIDPANGGHSGQYDIAALVAAIKSYEGGGASSEISHIETHISHVFLTEKYAYKLKKAVLFEFLDYSTQERRHEACLREVELNRRTAADAYLGVVHLCSDDNSGFVIEGSGPILESLVKMRRLPSRLMMDEKIASNSLESKEVDSLIQTLNNFYAGASRVQITVKEFTDNLRHQIDANFFELFRDTHCLDHDLIRRIRNRQLQFLEFNSEIWANRVSEKMIVDGHGDLRPEHICLEPTPKIFDCVEFSDSFRHLDILDELCFLALECERLGRDDVGKAILHSQNHRVYGGNTDDLIQFYMSYRACVRAKVALLRSLQSSGEDRNRALALANKYLDLADRSMGCESKPLCLIVRGLIGSGKSTVARRLSDRLGMTLVQSDKVRREIYSSVEANESYGGGVYTPGSRNHVYEEMLDSAVASLRSRTSTILDACFLQKELQQRVQYQVDAMGVKLIIVNCECPQEVAVTRVLERMKDPSCLSDARPEHWLDQARDDEGPIAGVPTINLKTSGAGPDALCDELITYIKHIVSSEFQTSSRAKQVAYCDTNAEVSRSLETSRLATLANVCSSAAKSS